MRKERPECFGDEEARQDGGFESGAGREGTRRKKKAVGFSLVRAETRGGVTDEVPSGKDVLAEHREGRSTDILCRGLWAEQ